MKKVLLGMSGGVDSSVAAILLKKQGYEVIGATMKLWNADKGQTIEDARNVCKQLEIKHYILDFEKEFEECVINNFVLSYKQGKTPNPCIECNKHLKFNYFYQKAEELGCQYIATRTLCKNTI